jgi:hypothetical protein
MRTAAQASIWTWIVLSVGWLAMVAWVAIMEPIDQSAPWAYVMTAVAPPVSLFAIGAVSIWAAKAFFRCMSTYFARLAPTTRG